MKETNVTINVTLDENNIPEKIIWSAPDGGVSDFPAKAAIIAPTIITDEIAFVTDIKGVCNEGVTLHTT